MEYLNKIDKSKKALIISVKEYLPHFGIGEKNTQILLDWYNGKSEQLKDFELGVNI